MEKFKTLRADRCTPLQKKYIKGDYIGEWERYFDVGDYSFGLKVDKIKQRFLIRKRRRGTDKIEILCITQEFMFDQNWEYIVNVIKEWLKKTKY